MPQGGQRGDAARSHSPLPAIPVPCRTPWPSFEERLEQSRGDLYPRAMGKVGRGDLGVSCLARGDVEEEKRTLMHSTPLCQVCHTMGCYCPKRGLLQGKRMSGARGMPTLGCGFHLGGNQLDYSGDASGVKIIYMLGSVMDLCRCTLNLHNPVKRELACIYFF